MENPNFKAVEANQQAQATGQSGSDGVSAPSFASSPPPYPMEAPAYYPPPMQAQYGPPPPHPTVTTIYGNSQSATFVSPQVIHLQPTATTVRPGTTTVIVTQPVGLLGPDPTRILCQHCQADVTTHVTYQTGMITHICGILFCLFCCPCVCVPYLTNCSKDSVHSCPNCKQHIGMYKRCTMGPKSFFVSREIQAENVNKQNYQLCFDLLDSHSGIF